MASSRRNTQILAVAALLALGLFTFFELRARAIEPVRLLARLPTHDALLLYADFDALRGGGILKLLDGSGISQEADYRSFVAQTKFDYTSDLDSVIAAFGPSGNYMFVKGRFDWPALQAYAVSQHGHCEAGLCSMQGSTAQRRISFFALRSNVLALAVSPDDTAVMRLKTSADLTPAVSPEGPVWISIPPSTLRSGEGLPTGTRMFAHAVQQAQSATMTLAMVGARMEARLKVVCATAQDATDAADQMTRATILLQQMIEREHGRPNPADFSGVLASGTFRSQGVRAFGYWPIEQAFIENLKAAPPAP